MSKAYTFEYSRFDLSSDVLDTFPFYSENYRYAMDLFGKQVEYQFMRINEFYDKRFHKGFLVVEFIEPMTSTEKESWLKKIEDQIGHSFSSGKLNGGNKILMTKDQAVEAYANRPKDDSPKDNIFDIQDDSKNEIWAKKIDAMLSKIDSSISKPKQLSFGFLGQGKGFPTTSP